MQEGTKAQALRSLIDQLSASMTSVDTALLVFQTAGLKRLADAGAALVSCEMEAEDIRRKLLAARGREKTLSAKAALFQMMEERKMQEEEGLEAALHMTTKACRKTGML